jgi:hypothetical protein
MYRRRPLKAHFSSDYDSCSIRNTAPLSSDLVENADDVNETLCKEEKLSYHVILPRFLLRFFPGYSYLSSESPLDGVTPSPVFVLTHPLNPSDTGNVNPNIPDPGVDEDRNPTIYYGTALTRYLSWLWNLRITYPKDDTLQMTDDISAASHRVLYHPEIAPAFATVWANWLILPVSSIFGGRDSPGSFMWKGEIRSPPTNHATLPPSAYETPLVQRLWLQAPPTPTEIATFSPAIADAINPGILIDSSGEPERRQPPFVDDAPNADACQHFITSIAVSVYSAYIVFGHPEEDPLQPPCINPNKWTDEVFHYMHFLGYYIDSGTMTMAWPIAKHQKLQFFLTTLLQDNDANKRSTPLSISRVLGLIRHASVVSPMGYWRSLQLQFFFNEAMSRAGARPSAAI